MPPYDLLPRTWCSIFTPMPRTYARSRLGSTFFFGCIPTDTKPIQLNGPILTVASICKFVMASAAEAELGAASTTAKTVQSYDLAWKNSATNNLLPWCIVITLPQWLSFGQGTCKINTLSIFPILILHYFCSCSQFHWELGHWKALLKSFLSMYQTLML